MRILPQTNKFSFYVMFNINLIYNYFYWAALIIIVVEVPKWRHKIAGNDVIVKKKLAKRSRTVYNGSVLFRPFLHASYLYIFHFFRYMVLNLFHEI